MKLKTILLNLYCESMIQKQLLNCMQTQEKNVIASYYNKKLMKRISFLFIIIAKKKKTIKNKLHSYKLEVLAIINAQLEKLKVYLLKIKFQFVMNCKALKKTLKTLEKKVRKQRGRYYFSKIKNIQQNTKARLD